MTAQTDSALLAIRVAFVLLPNSLILDWAGPAEALRVTNRILNSQGKPERFALEFVGPEARAISSVGVEINGLTSLPVPPNQPGSTDPRPLWLVLVGQVGEQITLDQPHSRALLNWLRPLRLEPGRLELVTVCAGAIIAAHAGLLSGRRVTTHHQHLGELSRVAPDAHVVANRVFVEDGALCSSAGVTTGIDLMLYRISALCGPALAARVAQTLVVALRRGPQDPELSPFLSHRDHLHPALHRVQDAISQDPQVAWTLARMANVACTSSRHLARLFLAHAGIAPLDYVCQIRLAMARAALQAGMSVTQSAELAGFNSDTQLRRAWHRQGVAGTLSTHGV